MQKPKYKKRKRVEEEEEEEFADNEWDDVLV